ncbi:MAG: hypothetical protein JWR23_2395 [Mucilaginibacter sp.]|nr:hypothetical protein [Mucilaginibacter sp.]
MGVIIAKYSFIIGLLMSQIFKILNIFQVLKNMDSYQKYDNF